VLEIFWHLARASEGAETPGPAVLADLSLTTFAQEAQDYLAAHHAEPLTIDEIARHFHLSRQYFTKLFRRVTGQPPYAYLTQVRLQRARELLTSSELTVQAIAAAVGFCDPYYFSRCFRQHTGLSPTQYRLAR
jgi:AraC-like DNA-binding protein